MVRGTFANIRLKNLMVPGVEGGVTVHVPSGERMDIFDAAERYRAEGHAPRGDRGQGVRQRLLARLGGQGDAAPRRARGDRGELRAHPSQQPGGHGRAARCSSRPGENAESLGLTGQERLTIAGLAGELRPRQDVTVAVERKDGTRSSFTVTARLDTPVEINYYGNGGILQTVLRKMLRGN